MESHPYSPCLQPRLASFWLQTSTTRPTFGGFVSIHAVRVLKVSLNRSGRWRSRYVIDLAKGQISGKVFINVHYYEQGNVSQMLCRETAAHAKPCFPGSTPNHPYSITLARSTPPHSGHIPNCYKTLEARRSARGRVSDFSSKRIPRDGREDFQGSPTSIAHDQIKNGLGQGEEY